MSALRDMSAGNVTRRISAEAASATGGQFAGEALKRCYSERPEVLQFASPMLPTSRLVMVLFVLVVAAAAVWPSWPPLITTWHVMDSYAHGWLLTIFVIGWIVARSAELPPTETRVSPGGLILLLASLVAWMIAYRAASAIGQQVLLPIILWSAVWTGCGIQTASIVAPPIACLYFVIPIWEFLLPALQHTTVFVAEAGLGLLGVPVHIDGVLVSIPEGTFKIAEGCAGKRYFIVALAIAALYAGTARMRPWRACAFLAMTAALALFTNWIRVITVIYAGHVTNMTSYLVAKEHISFGWALFALLVLLILVLGGRFARDASKPHPNKDVEADSKGMRGARLRPAAGALIVALCLPPLAIFQSQHAVAAASASLHLPHSIGNWDGPRMPDRLWAPRYSGTSDTVRTAYRGDRGDVQLYVAEYGAQMAGAKLISSANTLLSPDWTIARSGTLQSRSSAEPLTRIGAVWAATARGQRWLITYEYLVGTTITSSPIVAQLVYGARSWMRATPSRVVAMAVPCQSDCTAELPRTWLFWDSLGARLLAASSMGK